MERWSKAPQRRGYESFSSTLLDAIYRSIDDECQKTSNPAGGAPRQRCAGRAPDSFVPVTAGDKSTTAVYRSSAAYGRNAAGMEKAPSRLQSCEGTGLLHTISTSSSSDNSSYGGFSSSEPESATAPSVRLRPIRTAPITSAAVRSSARAPCHAPPLTSPRTAPSKLSSPPVVYLEDNMTTASIRSNLRGLRKSKTPGSPGVRLARFLNSLFTSAGGKPRKSKGYTPVTPVGGGVATTAVDDSSCSTASSYYRSCLSKTPTSRRTRHEETALEAASRRSVQFCSVGVIVDEDLRPRGQKSVYEEVPVAQPAETKWRVEREAKRRVEELLRRNEEEDDWSDSSSDLFELEIRRESRGGEAGAGIGYWDELPVYETTHHHYTVGANRPVSRHF